MAILLATATFTGGQPLDGDFPYVDVTWATPYSAVGAYRVFAGVGVTDSNGAIVINLKSKSTTGVRVLASDQFTGSVELIAMDT